MQAILEILTARIFPQSHVLFLNETNFGFSRKENPFMKTIRLLGIVLALIVTMNASATAMASPIDHAMPSTVLAEPTKTPPSQSGDNNQKIAQAIADALKVPVAEILALRDKNMGYGEIVIAYALKQTSGKSVSEILAMRTAGQGWGEIAKNLNPEHTKLTKLGQLLHGKETTNTVAPGNSGEHRQDTNKGNDDKGKDEQGNNKTDNKGKDNNQGNDKGKGN